MFIQNIKNNTPLVAVEELDNLAYVTAAIIGQK